MKMVKPGVKIAEHGLPPDLGTSTHREVVRKASASLTAQR